MSTLVNILACLSKLGFECEALCDATSSTFVRLLNTRLGTRCRVFAHARARQASRGPAGPGRGGGRKR